MPTYAYACKECGHRFEIVQAFTDAPLTECPECSGRLRKLFSPVGVVFKGSGFYRTDSRKSATGSDKDKKAEKKEPSTAGSAESSADAKANPSSSTSGTTTQTKAAS